MSRIEKLTMGAVLFVSCASAFLYGVWQDKMVLYSPLVMLVYMVAAMWAICSFRCQRQKRREQRSEVSLSGDAVAKTGDGRPKTEDGRRKTEDRKLSTSDFRPLTSRNQIPPGGIWLLLFWLYNAIMIPFSVLPYEAKVSTLRFGCYLATYWVVANILSRFSRRKTVWSIIVVVLILIALYSLVHHRIAPQCLLWTERYVDRWEEGRLAGTYICPNHIAHLYQMWVPLCLTFLLVPQFGWFWRICFGYALPLFLLLIYQTQSRAGLLGVVAALGVTLLMLILRKSRKGFLLALLIIPLLCAGAVGGLWVGSAMFRERMQPVVEVLAKARQGDWTAAINADFRPRMWMDAVGMFKARPVFGFGPGNFNFNSEEYREWETSPRMLIDYPHNEPLQLLVEYGIVGALLVVCAAICGGVALVRITLTAKHSYQAFPAAAMLGILAGTFVHGLFDFELRIFPNAMMLALLAGCAVAPSLSRKTEGGRRRSEDGGRRTEDGGRRTEDGGRKTEDGRRRTEDGGRKTEDGRRRTGDGGRGTEDGGRRTEDGRRLKTEVRG